MTGGGRPEQDLALPLFAPPEPLPEPGLIEPELAIASPASDRPFRLEGERVTVQGTQRGTVTSIRVDGVRVVGGLEAEAGAVANTVLSPGRIRRERIGAAGSLQETVLVAPTLPWVVLHWTGPADVMLHPLPEARNVRYHTRGGLATVADPTTGRVLALSVVPGEATWTAEVAAGRGLLLRAGRSGGPRMLVVAYGTPEAVRTALLGISHLGTHEARAVTGVPDALELRTGALELDHAVAWLTTRLRHGVLRTDLGTKRGGDAHDGEGWMWAGLGSVVGGDTDGALRCIQNLRRAEAHTAAGLVAGRLALTTGHVEAAQESVDALLSGSSKGRDEALARLARRTVADGLRYGATPETLARLREGQAGSPASPDPPAHPSPSADAAPPAPSAGRRLPTIGSPPASEGIGARLAGMLEPSGTTAPPALPTSGQDWGTEEVANALRAWSELSRRPAAGWASWRSLVHGGMDGSRGGAAWDDLYAPPATTGVLLAAMVHGWLGSFPDAPVGRLVLTPRIPGSMTTFGVAGLPVGDARITMRYERRDGIHGFTFDIGRGRVPPYLVFEIEVPHGVGRVLLDGTPIDPDVERRAAGTTVRLQTALDARRVVQIEPG